ncbi:MAG: Rv2578c family radical SAM protein, partial [Streptosporangiaceae bacterium]|nr:Rv2578c family radical SAM protein [Streptosporangiaceae bacterium]
MRWDTLRLDDAAADAPAGEDASLPLFERGAVVRTFDTPGFRGMTFYEVQAKSIVNRVPESSRMPFRWTINPYRGCQHACRYCQSGDTPVLMADGRTKPLADLREGDAVYGTERDGLCRRYVKTTVLAHWRTVKPAYRITLEDGTRLIASGDHRFLTQRGWRHVTGAEQGPPRRPFLTVGSKLMGTGSKLMGAGGFAEPPRCSIDGVALKSDAKLRVAAIEPLGFEMPMYDITTGTGDFIANGVVSHNCFARNTHTYLDLDAGHDFDSKVIVKVNAPELLRRRLASPGWPGEHIAMGTNVDCYQRAEGRYRLMRGIIAALRDAANPFSILTKGTLILRDLDLLLEAAEVTEVGLNVSAAFVDKALWRSIEPGTPAPERRLEVCAALTDSGLRCGVLMGPVVPFLSDSPAQLDAAVRRIAEAGAAHVTPIVLHLRPGTREWFMSWLRATHPELGGRYAALYGRGSYAQRDYQARISAQVRELAERYGVGRGQPRG